MEIYKGDVEIFEFAISKEIEAYEFYCALAERMIDTEKQKMFEELAAEELEHKAALELELMKLGQVTTTVDVENLDKVEYEIEGDQIFDMEYADILTLAIEKETAAFRLYALMASNVTDKASADMLLTLAEQEVRHKLRFEYEYENILKKGLDNK